MQTTPRINPEFKALIPPLTPDEYAQLEENILAHGCRDPITLWRGWVIDGHNRHEICTQHGLKYETITMSFPTRDAAKLWIMENQLGRRNLTNAQRIELAARKAKHMGLTTYVNRQIARDAGLSEKTVQRYMQVITRGDPELIEKVLTGDMTIGTAHRQLELITTTREQHEVPEMCPKFKAAVYKRGALSHIRQIENLYMFLSRHRQDCAEVSDAIPPQFAAHSKRLGKLLERFG